MQKHIKLYEEFIFEQYTIKKIEISVKDYDVDSPIQNVHGSLEDISDKLLSDWAISKLSGYEKKLSKGRILKVESIVAIGPTIANGFAMSFSYDDKKYVTKWKTRIYLSTTKNSVGIENILKADNDLGTEHTVKLPKSVYYQHFGSMLNWLARAADEAH